MVMRFRLVVLEKSNQIDEEEDRLYGSDKCGDELPDKISTKEKRQKTPKSKR